MSKQAMGRAKRWMMLALVGASTAACAASTTGLQGGAESGSPVAQPALRLHAADVVQAPAGDADGATSANGLGARQVLGFALGTTTVGDVIAWADAQGTVCEVSAQGRRVRCRGVAADGLDGAPLAIDELELRFGARGRLHGVKVIRRGLSAARAQAHFGQLATRWGQPVDAEPAAQPYARAERSLEGHGLRASVVTTNFAERGFQLIERYQLG